LLRETYQTSHDQAAEERSTTLEVVIALTIVMMAFVRQ
jgi:hypothetical protein